MAKKKEKFASPFVPVEQQPYPIPENWCWVNLGTLIDLYRGVSYKKDDAHTEKLDDDYLIMRGGNILEGAINTEADNVYVNKQLVQEEQLVKKYDIIIVSSTGSSKVIGRAGISYNDYSDVAFGAFLLLARPNAVAVKPFVTLFFQTEIYRDRIRQLASGVNINNIRTDYIISTPIPLPPIPEQHRIVARIESLFAKLDEAKEKLQAVVDSFETRKAAILHRAFTGELTAKWRETHGVGMESWKKRKLKDCGDWNGGGTPSMAHPEYWDDGDLLWITSKDMKSDVIEDTLMRTNMVGVINSSAKYIEKPAVLFVMRSGILRRTLPIAMVKIPFTVNQDLKAITPVDDLNLEYFFWACKSAEKRILETCMKNGTTVESINAKALMEFEILIVSQPEQTEIVNCIVGLLDKEKRARETAEIVLDQIDLIKKSILARAFRGELETNEPGEESSEAILLQHFQKGGVASVH